MICSTSVLHRINLSWDHIISDNVDAATAWWFWISLCDPGGPGLIPRQCCLLLFLCEQETLLTLPQLYQLGNVRQHQWLCFLEQENFTHIAAAYPAV